MILCGDDVAGVVLFGMLAAGVGHCCALVGVVVEGEDGGDELFNVLGGDAEAASGGGDEVVDVAVGLGAGEEGAAAGHDFVDFGGHGVAGGAVFVEGDLEVGGGAQPGEVFVGLEGEEAQVLQPEGAGLVFELGLCDAVADDEEEDVFVG